MQIRAIILVFVNLLIGSSVTAQGLSTYQPDLCQSQSLTIIDSTLRFGNAWHGVYLDNGIGGEISDQYHYWKSNRDLIPDQDLFVLKNHPSPIVRYYTYVTLMDRDILESELDFLLFHLSDEEVMMFRSGCVGHYRPLILHVIYHGRLSGEENAVIAEAIAVSSTESKKLIEYSAKHYRAIDSQYDSIRTLAIQRDYTAVFDLLRYKSDQDQTILQEIIAEMLSLNSVKYVKRSSIHTRILNSAVKYNFPRGSLDLLYDFYESAKRDKALEPSLKRCGIIYELLMKYQHPNRAQVVDNFLQSDFLVDGRYNPLLKKISDLLSDNRGDDLNSARMLLWEKYGRVRPGSYVQDLYECYPARVLSLVIKEMDKIKTGNCKQYLMLKDYCDILITHSISIEEYLRLVFECEDSYSIYAVLRVLNNNPIPSLKDKVLNVLLNTDIEEHNFYPNQIFYTLSQYDLNLEDKEQIKQWCLTNKETVNFEQRYNPASLNMLLVEMEITLED